MITMNKQINQSKISKDKIKNDVKMRCQISNLAFKEAVVIKHQVDICWLKHYLPIKQHGQKTNYRSHQLFGFFLI